MLVLLELEFICITFLLLRRLKLWFLGQLLGMVIAVVILGAFKFVLARHSILKIYYFNQLIDLRNLSSLFVIFNKFTPRFNSNCERLTSNSPQWDLLYNQRLFVCSLAVSVYLLAPRGVLELSSNGFVQSKS